MLDKRTAPSPTIREGRRSRGDVRAVHVLSKFCEGEQMEKPAMMGHWTCNSGSFKPIFQRQKSGPDDQQSAANRCLAAQIYRQLEAVPSCECSCLFAFIVPCMPCAYLPRFGLRRRRPSAPSSGVESCCEIEDMYKHQPRFHLQSQRARNLSEAASSINSWSFEVPF